MKKILLPLALVSALLVSCEKPVQEEYYYISIYPHELHFALYGEEQSVIVDSSHDWELTDCPDWCVPSIKGGQSGAEIIFTVTENESDSQREGEIIFTCGDAADSIRVLQDGLNDNIEFSSSYIKESLTSEHRTDAFNGQKVIIDIDRDNDGEISYKEALDAKYMHINTGVRTDNFTELKYFPALEYAYIRFTSLDSINLTHCPNLKYLYISGDIPSLDLSNNTSLERLECSYNQLTSLDLSNNTALTYLICYGNQLTSLDLSNNTTLTYLSCFDNQLTSLDLSNNTALTQLYCTVNQLTSLDLSNNTALTELSCSNNQLTSLDVSNCTALTYLDCGGNQLTSLDLYNNRLIESLKCKNNLLQKLILYKYHIIKDSYIESIESEYGDIIEYME